MTPISGYATRPRGAGVAVGAGALTYPVPTGLEDPLSIYDRTTDLTVLAVGMQDAISNAQLSFSRAQGTGNPLWSVGLHGGSYNGAYCRIGSATIQPTSANNVAGATLRMRTVAASAGTSVVSLYMDGALQGEAGFTPAVPAYSTGRQVAFGALNLAQTASNGRPQLGLFWGRQLLSDEMSEVTSNPWQLFEPERIWVPVSAASAPEVLGPGRLDNSNSIFAPSVAPGSVTASQARVNNAQTFYAPALSIAPRSLAAKLLTNDSAFYAAGVVPGGVSIAPSLHVNAAVFYPASVTGAGAAVAPGLLTNTSAFHAASVAPGPVSLAASRLENSNAFHAPTVSSGGALLPTLLTNASVFYSPAVIAHGASIAAPLVVNQAAFFAPAVSAGAVALIGPQLASTQIFYPAAVVNVGAAIQSALLVNASEFYAPAVTVGDITLAPPLLVGVQIFYPATVGDGLLPIIDSVFLRYVVPGRSLAFSVPGQSLTYSVPQ